MRFRLALLVVVCTIFAPFAAASADDAPAYSMPVRPDFSAMNFLFGTWSCTTKSARRPTPVASTDTYELDPTGYYVKYESKSDPVPWANFPQSIHQMITYDSELKQWAAVLTSDTGDYGLFMSAGWKDGKMIWHPVNNTPYLDIASTSDFTLTKVSDTHTTNASSFTTKSGATVAVSGSCTKSP
ncbi:MAG: hypothetical protein ABSB70_11400 [Candidatus Velthaea sp.]|jgi:hypothetical protein